MSQSRTDFATLFVDEVALLDVRAPVEFAKGAFPQAVNLPLMDDLERQRVGTRYKRQGQQAALELGHRLVSGELKRRRIESWARFARAHPEGCLYCFRGGLRSQIVQRWLRDEAGIDYPRVAGGYKALRGFLSEVIERAVVECEWVRIGGLTGVGKTEVLAGVANAVDLEGLACHRGSSFGGRVTPQPAQIDFEHRLAIALLKLREAGTARLIVEDEGGRIGRCMLPLALQRRMQRAPLIWLEAPLSQRIERVLKDYVIDLRAEFIAAFGLKPGLEHFAERLEQSLASLSKRLGVERYRRLAALMSWALASSAEESLALHRGWIHLLLDEYYDPIYRYQRDSQQQQVLFSGEREAVLDYLRSMACAR
ncbi:tRNA 2-selenouridine(34) synthase MnmH [Halotalea alkalilenta]|uniref:tRNA 2-selenouridine synthase n=1 Tax=Halotalea alkalilenta TaxID=376489 RepID=A0A172YDQ4_9GAMM|nr:tRNA 2-selenouridine(34) synthase MnmH [Halotalea alkalilenta]ANF57353.1 tRNA 2-selenouridine(34) synthase MnmH [Halotalea alkalilenta]